MIEAVFVAARLGGRATPSALPQVRLAKYRGTLRAWIQILTSRPASRSLVNCCLPSLSAGRNSMLAQVFMGAATTAARGGEGLPALRVDGDQSGSCSMRDR